MSSFPIAVLLATYNGERFIAEQLESLWQQSRQDFILIVHDDSSTDGTLRLLHDVQRQRPDRVKLLDSRGPRLGAKASFSILLSNASAPFIAFCDQDDYWLPHKLERQVAALEEAEARFGCNTALLCCGDASVADASLSITHPSFFDKHRFSIRDGRDSTLARMLFRNFAIGATTMINAPLAAKCHDMPAEAIMHDWWCALVACALGKTLVLREPVMLYRQHDSNTIGSKQRKLPITPAQTREVLDLSRTSTARCIRQARALHARFALDLPLSARSVLERYASFASQSKIERVLTVLQTRAFKPGAALNALHLYSCITAHI